MKLILQRDKPKDKVVFGKFYIPWLNFYPDIYAIVPNPPIPAGVYRLLAHNTPKFKDVWQLENVPGHTGILIHEGNFASDVTFADGSFHKTDSTNCILPGFSLNEDIPMVLYSKKAMDYLRTIIGIKAHGEYTNVDLEIRDFY